jgi:predicted transcriptional regulator of viral defense system
MPPAGLTAVNRKTLAQLRRTLPGPFTAAEAAAAADLAPERASRLLRHLAAQGWLTRISRGLYAAVPIEAEDPRTWRVDPWVIAATTLAPSYIGGWSALHHWDLTDQLFGTTLVVTARPVPHREREIGGARFELRRRPVDAHFGTRSVWREGIAVEVSDPERTLIDCLDDPSLGGGVRHVAEALRHWHDVPRANPDQLIAYGEWLGNRTAFKRLGFLLEALDIQDSGLIEACRERISSGVSLLDPGRAPDGSITTRWNLRVNAVVE